MRKLNSLDLAVKRMMLEYPSLFPSRIDALAYLFCVNGTGYEWQDGILKNMLEPETPMPTHIDPPEPYNLASIGNALDEYEVLRLEYEGLVRGFREKHIDFLCNTNHSELGPEKAFTSVYPMSWDYCRMGYAADHPHRINDEWRAGILEFIHWYLPKVNGYYGCWNDPLAKEPDVDRIADPRVKSNYVICQKVLKMLKTDEDRKRDKLMMKDMRKMLHKINEEEK